MNYSLKLLFLKTMKVKKNTNFYRERESWQNKYGWTNRTLDSIEDKWDYDLVLDFNEAYYPYPMFGSTKTFNSLKEVRFELLNQININNEQIQKHEKNILFLNKAIIKIKELEGGVSE